MDINCQGISPKVFEIFLVFNLFSSKTAAIQTAFNFESHSDHRVNQDVLYEIRAGGASPSHGGFSCHSLHALTDIPPAPGRCHCIPSVQADRGPLSLEVRDRGRQAPTDLQRHCRRIPRIRQRRIPGADRQGLRSRCPLWAPEVRRAQTEHHGEEGLAASGIHTH